MNEATVKSQVKILVEKLPNGKSTLKILGEKIPEQLKNELIKDFGKNAHYLGVVGVCDSI